MADHSEPGISEPGETEPRIPDEALRAALEFAVTVAAASARGRPPRPVPAGLRRFLRSPNLSATGLAAVRAVVEADPGFRAVVAERATPDLVDPVGLLWLTRPDGWQRRAIESLTADAGIAGVAAREERKRRGAEDALARVRRELAEALLAHERAMAEAAEREAALEAELVRLRARLDEARAKVRAAQRPTVRPAESAASTDHTSDLADMASRLAEAEAARDRALEALADLHAPAGATVDLERLRRLLADATAVLGGRPAGRGHRRAGRRPLAVPGGLLADGVAAAEHLVRHRGVSVVVDGYNVAKLGWPARTLAEQRDALVAAAERLAVRWGVAIHIVFDGADVVGAHTRSRRLVRVTYSPPGVIADDVIRAEVAALPVDRPVVVVTDDQAIVADVRGVGANLVGSATFLALVGA